MATVSDELVDKIALAIMRSTHSTKKPSDVREWERIQARAAIEAIGAYLVARGKR